MPNIRGSKKRMRQAERRKHRNRAQRSTLRSAIKKVTAASDPKDAAPAYRDAERLLDRAAQKGLIKKNKAARHKHRLRKLVAARSK